MLAQSDEKIKNNLKLTTTPGFSCDYTISFDHKVAGKHGFENVMENFTKSFTDNGFKVTNTNPRYIATMDYKYGYAIYAYKMQYSNLTGEIIDLENNKQVVATFTYNGKYDNDTISNGLAKALKNATKL